MRREDVRPLLAKAVDPVLDPDLADAAWAGGLTVRRRQRRVVQLAVVAVIAILVALSIAIGLS